MLILYSPDGNGLKFLIVVRYRKNLIVMICFLTLTLMSQ
jgi:hypothetical protein